MSQSTFTIGELAALTQCNVPTIRYYEQIGLLPPAERAANGHRSYQDAALRKLVFVRRCRDFGFPIEQVRQLVHMLEEGDGACVEVRDLVQTNLDQIRIKMEEMRQLENSLAAFVESCTTVCASGQMRDCAIIEDLSLVNATSGENSDTCCRPSVVRKKNIVTTGTKK